MRSRLVILVCLLSLWLLGLGTRLHQLQIREHEEYRDRAASQQRRVLDLEPPRGTIYDSRGRVLAVSAEVESAFADPSEVRDPGAAAEAIGTALGLDVEKLTRRLSSDRDFVFLARKLDPPRAAEIRKLEIPGVHFLRENKRYYPLRSLAAPVLGFVGTDHEGLAGLEAHYDELIGGRAGRRTVLRDARRRTLLSPRLTVVEAEPGADLHLTLDASIQHIVERELSQAVERSGARRGIAVFLEPETGAILAMAQSPGFDPNRFSDFSPPRWRNRAVTDAYEPGSTFKMVTIAAVLETGLLGPEDELDCEMGSIVLAGQRIRDHHPFGELTVRQVLAKSSNVGAIKMGLLLGEGRLHGALTDFGFGRVTGIDLPGESPGIVRAIDDWSALSKAYVSFGQELSVTSLQMARAVAAVANGGLLPEPYVVARADGEDGFQRRGRASEMSRAVSSSVAAELTRMLRGVVDRGPGSRARLPGYTVAGKTGTAQKAIDGAYSHTRFVASFAGFAPAVDPRLAGIVVLDEPTPAYHGGQVAAPVFASMAREMLLYWGIPPDGEEDLHRPEGGPPSLVPTAPESRPGPAITASLVPRAPSSSTVGGAR
ncbi:MAG: penicillin-binding protein 2 [Thermoanaerobaculia bacterium]|nr:penicillin-binding protein 2 [Thermoanaerobaculia bacterium]